MLGVLADERVWYNVFEMLEIIQVAIGTLGLIVAIVAIFMTKKEIKSQNAQCLFDKRLDNYVICKKIYNLTQENLSLLKHDADKDEPIEVATPFLFLTNCVFLEEASGVINDIDNFELKKKFLIKIEELITISEKSRLLFPSDIGEPLSDFVFSYQNVIMQLYKYQRLLELIHSSNDNHPAMLGKTFPELAKMFKESSHRKELEESIRQLNKSFKKMKNENIIFRVQIVTHL